MTATEAQSVAQGIYDKALRHHELAKYHKAKGRRLMKRFQLFKDRLAEMGIAVKGEGEIVHGRRANGTH